MLGDISVARDIYIACGYTDMRKSIDGLAAIVQQQFQMATHKRRSKAHFLAAVQMADGGS